mmetsp:Transcript_27258/g.33016  ORF Transcript_27258/g.33016 Transcript_27258/m.33016 type:complete len:294 (-) Transcript_27258:259-1140(-)
MTTDERSLSKVYNSHRENIDVYDHHPTLCSPESSAANVPLNNDNNEAYSNSSDTSSITSCSDNTSPSHLFQHLWQCHGDWEEAAEDKALFTNIESQNTDNNDTEVDIHHAASLLNISATAFIPAMFSSDTNSLQDKLPSPNAPASPKAIRIENTMINISNTSCNKTPSENSPHLADWISYIQSLISPHHPTSSLTRSPTSSTNPSPTSPYTKTTISRYKNIIRTLRAQIKDLKMQLSNTRSSIASSLQTSFTNTLYARIHDVYPNIYTTTTLRISDVLKILDSIDIVSLFPLT